MQRQRLIHLTLGNIDPRDGSQRHRTLSPVFQLLEHQQHLLVQRQRLIHLTLGNIDSRDLAFDDQSFPSKRVARQNRFRLLESGQRALQVSRLGQQAAVGQQARPFALWVLRAGMGVGVRRPRQTGFGRLHQTHRLTAFAGDPQQVGRDVDPRAVHQVDGPQSQFGAGAGLVIVGQPADGPLGAAAQEIAASRQIRHVGQRQVGRPWPPCRRAAPGIPQRIDRGPGQHLRFGFGQRRQFGADQGVDGDRRFPGRDQVFHGVPQPETGQSLDGALAVRQP